LYLKEYFRSFDASEFDSPDKVIAWNDITALNRLLLDSEDTDAVGHRWAKRIVYRRHHRHVFSLNEGDGPNVVRVARKVFERIKSDFQEIDFVADLPDEPVSIHKIARDDDRESRLIDFPLIENGRRTSLGERSQILKSLPLTFRVGYIFADVEDKGKRDEIINQCRKIKNEETN